MTEQPEIRSQRTQNRREIVVTLNQAHHQSSRLDDAEKIAKVLSLILIPIILTTLGAIIQKKLKNTDVAVEYVKISKEILSDPESNPELIAWATSLVKKYCDIPFPDPLVKQFEDGTLRLPGGNQPLLIPAPKVESLDLGIPQLQDPTWTVYVFLGDRTDRGWETAQLAEGIMARLHVLCLSDRNVLRPWGLDDRIKGIVFGWDDRPRFFLVAEQTNNSLYVFRAVQEARSIRD